MLKVTGYLIFSLRGLPALVKFRPQIIHLHTALPIVFGVVGKWLTGSKLVATIHGTELSWIVKSRFLRSMLNHADAICYVSSSMHPKLRESLTVPTMKHTPSGVDLDIFKWENDPRDTFILAVGNFREEKGFDILIEAFASINRKLPEFKLVLVGDGPGRPKIEHIVRYYGLEKSVLFKGTCHREEVAKLMRESKLLVMSSRSEGEPKVLLESIASGTPVVVTDVGGCQALAQGKGLIVPPEDPGALSTATIKMLTDADLWSSFHEACKTSINVLGWHRTVAALEELYESLASTDLSTNS
ncbi:glycosyltransferase [Dehalococcoidia bacterium]|nr:glycosyltransferase [Dehalococcoidia bacterium]